LLAKSETLFSLHRDAVFRYFCRRVGRYDAQDLTQEVFLRLTRSPVPETTSDGERAWIFRIARNLAINHWRADSRRPETVEFTDMAKAAPQETSLAMQQALDDLPALDRDIFLLREVAGLSYEEIAASCELTVPAIRARLHRVRVTLRERLQPLFRHPDLKLVRLYDKR